eukprot:scaffold7551_cov123-Isochrysis_galbana.AAC.12
MRIAAAVAAAAVRSMQQRVRVQRTARGQCEVHAASRQSRVASSRSSNSNTRARGGYVALASRASRA